MPRDGSAVPLFGVSNKGLSPVVSSQRRENLYVEMPMDPEKGQIALFPRPGLTEFTTFAPPVPGAPSTIRGFSETFYYDSPANGLQLLAVVAVGGSLFTVSPSAGFVNSLSNILTTVGPVVMAQNPTQVLVVDGAAGYIISKATLTVTQVTAAWFPNGATTCCFIAGRFVANDPGTGQFRYSDLNDGNSGSSLNFYTAESDPDNCLAVAADHGELVVFGEFTTEFWSPGSGSTAFQRVGGAALEYGLAAVESLRKSDSGLMFLGRNRLGDLKAMVGRGYQAVPISTPAIETEFQALANIGAGVGMSFSANGHSFYALSFPERSFMFDATSKTWGDLSSGVDGERWIGQYGVLLGNNYLVSDYRNTNLYILDPDAATDAGEVIVREVVTRHVFPDFDRTSVYKLGVDFETGVGLVGEGEPQVMLQVSRDNGRTWGNEVWQSLGAIGEYMRRVWFRIGGRARDWLFRLRITDPVKVVIAGGVLKVGP